MTTVRTAQEQAAAQYAAIASRILTATGRDAVPISVGWRSDWEYPSEDRYGHAQLTPSEFNVVLDDGRSDPVEKVEVRITGSLDKYGQASWAVMQYRSSSTVWIDYSPGPGGGKVTAALRSNVLCEYVNSFLPWLRPIMTSLTDELDCSRKDGALELETRAREIRS